MDVVKAEHALSRLRAEFSEYREQFERAYECARLLLECRERGFSNPVTAALSEQTLRSALEDYFRLRAQIDWWLAQVRHLVSALTEMERVRAGTIEIVLDDTIRESALRNMERN